MTIEVRWTTEYGSPRSIVFEPHDDEWVRVEFEWTDNRWREVGREFVTGVGIFDESHPTSGCRPQPDVEGGEADE